MKKNNRTYNNNFDKMLNSKIINVNVRIINNIYYFLKKFVFNNLERGLYLNVIFKKIVISKELKSLLIFP